MAVGTDSKAPITGQEEINHFKAIPWCAKHLNAPNLAILPVYSSLCRRHDAEEFEEALMCSTLRTPDTIPAFVLFYPRPQDETAPLPEVKALFTLGNLVGGHTGIAHGGVSATLCDEILSFIVPGPRLRVLLQRGQPTVTAYLNMRYLRPLAVPATHLATARLVKAEGNKFFVEGWIENQAGERVVEADALYIQLRSKL